MSNTTSPAEIAHLQAAEKRQSPRVTVDVRARVSVQSANGVTTICHGLGTNLSDKGMAVHLPLELQVGKKLKLVVLLDSAQFQISCEGTIRNRRGHRYGIEFDNLPSEDRDLILRCSGDNKH